MPIYHSVFEDVGIASDDDTYCQYVDFNVMCQAPERVVITIQVEGQPSEY